MSLTLPELQDKMKQIDEISLVERLDISSEDIVDRFVDKIEDNFEQLELEFDEEEDE